MDEKEKNGYITQAKRSVGYAESESKEEFVKGAVVAIDYVLKDCHMLIKQAQRESSINKARCANVTGDMQTLVDIISKYQD